MFTDAEIVVVRSTWAKAAENPAAAAALFYGRLFEVAPEVKPLFTADMKEQGLKLMKMIGVAVNNMDRVETIVPALQEMGSRHVGYGAKDEHYPVVGAVLIETLDRALGDDFTDEARAAWTKTYETLASVMIS